MNKLAANALDAHQVLTEINIYLFDHKSIM